VEEGGRWEVGDDQGLLEGGSNVFKSLRIKLKVSPKAVVVGVSSRV
jgi:hypothetical protein